MIPLVINNRNRLTTLKAMINWFSDLKIIILDNDSTYPPLLEYYKEIDAEVVFMGKNYGHTVLYQWKGHLNFPERYFLYSDSDVVPREDCPKDLVEYLLNAKKTYPGARKIGVALEINDLPETELRNEIISWESKFWKQKYDDFFIADVDTTLAIYDNTTCHSHGISNSLRTNYPYVARHLPWYTKVLSYEDRYYIKNADAKLPNGKLVGMWTQKMHRLRKLRIL